MRQLTKWLIWSQVCAAIGNSVVNHSVSGLIVATVVFCFITGIILIVDTFWKESQFVLTQPFKE